MTCSNCKQDGHTKKNCKNKTLLPETVKLTHYEKVSIRLEESVKTKLTALGSRCTEVATGLGKGHVEGVYQQALSYELQDVGIRHVMEETMPILYKGRPVGGGHSQRLDIMLLNFLPFIFELKAVSKPICPEHHWQLVRYMVYKKQPYGAVVNFNQSDKGTLEIQFIVKQDEVFYLYDLETGTGSELCDFGLVKTSDEWGWE